MSNKTLSELLDAGEFDPIIEMARAIAAAKWKITVHGATIEGDGGAFTVAGAVRALGRGFSEDIRNSGAGMASGVNSIQAEIMSKTGADRDDAYRGWCAYAGLAVDAIPESPKAWADFTAACMLQIMRDKAADVYTGTVRAGGGGPRKSEEERLRDDETLRRIIAALPDAEGKAFKEMKVRERAPVLKVYYEANKASIDKTVAALLKTTASAGEGLTLAGLLAQVAK